MAVKAYYIPNGPLNLASHFPTINFEEVAEYYVEVIDNLDAVVATSPMNQICGCEEDADCIRIHFLNGAGGIDAVNFKLKNREHEPKSQTTEKPTSYPLVRTEHAINRTNIKSNDTFKAVTIDYQEEDMDWLDELLDSPLAWAEWPETQGLSAGLVPIVILDKKSDKFKENDRYTYEVEVDFIFSHQKFIIRN